jgi:CNT family concentrative nucleoside transporter
MSACSAVPIRCSRRFYAKHLLAASIMAAPATLVIAKILMPETGTPLTRGTVRWKSKDHEQHHRRRRRGRRRRPQAGAEHRCDAARLHRADRDDQRAADLDRRSHRHGSAMLGKPTDLANLFGYMLAPIAWVIGVPWQDANTGRR